MRGGLQRIVGPFRSWVQRTTTTITSATRKIMGPDNYDNYDDATGLPLHFTPRDFTSHLLVAHRHLDKRRRPHRHGECCALVCASVSIEVSVYMCARGKCGVECRGVEWRGGLLAWRRHFSRKSGPPDTQLIKMAIARAQRHAFSCHIGSEGLYIKRRSCHIQSRRLKY